MRRPPRRVRLLLGALLAAFGCGQRAAPVPELLPVGAANEPLHLVLPAEPERTSVTPASVRLRDAAGCALPWRAELRGHELLLRVELDAAALAAAADGWTLELAGFPSRHALRWRDGGTLGATWSAPVAPAPALVAPEPPPRLAALDGRPLDDAAEHPTGPELELLVDGVLDLATLRPQDFPLQPLRGDLALEPLPPARLAARVRGARTILRLTLPPGDTDLLLRTRDWTARDVRGRPLDPGVVIRLARH